MVKGECPPNFKTTKHRPLFVTSSDMRRWSKPLPLLESEVPTYYHLLRLTYTFDCLIATYLPLTTYYSLPHATDRLTGWLAGWQSPSVGSPTAGVSLHLQAESVIDLFPLLTASPRDAPDGGADPSRRQMLLVESPPSEYTSLSGAPHLTSPPLPPWGWHCWLWVDLGGSGWRRSALCRSGRAAPSLMIS